MKVTFQDGEFRAFTSYTEERLRGELKKHGWRWAEYRHDKGERGKFWFAFDAGAVVPFLEYADQACKETLGPANLDAPGPPPSRAEIPDGRWLTDLDYMNEWCGTYPAQYQLGLGQEELAFVIEDD